MILLAFWLLRTDASHEATLAFALVLVTRGVSLFAMTAMMATDSVEIAQIATTVYCGLCLATVFAVVYFVGVYPARRIWRRDGATAPLVLLVLLIGIGIALTINPYIAIPDAPLTGTGPANVANWLAGNPRQPLGIAPTLLDLTMSLPAIAMLRDYLRAAPGKRRDTFLIVSLGFFAPASCSCMIAAIVQQRRGSIPTPQNPSVFNFIEMAIFAVWLIVIVMLLGYVAVRALRARTGQDARQIALFGLVVVASTLIGASTGLTQDPDTSIATIMAMLGFWSGLGAALVAYGILRYSLFDIELKLKVSVQRSTVAAVFVGVYFLVSEVGSVWFADVSGSAYWGIAAAALLLLALHPIQRLAERLADGLMPHTGELKALGSRARAEFYREHVDLMWMDGNLSPKDRIVLANLRARLGLDPSTAEAIELEVLAAVGSAPPEGEADRQPAQKPIS